MDNQKKFLESEIEKKKQSDVRLNANNTVEYRECFKWGNVMFEEMESEKLSVDCVKQNV